MRTLTSLAAVTAIIAILSAICCRGGSSESIATFDGKIAGKDDFILNPEWDESRMSANFAPGNTVDVNLGHTPRKNIEALFFQMAGRCPNEDELAKWKPFFSAIPRKHWYLFRGRPLIYFYNGGTIKNRLNSAEVFRLLKALFKEEFGVEPYLCSDSAFWGAGTKDVADNKFKWYSLDEPIPDASFALNGATLTHAMVRWDSTARENNQVERAAKANERICKDDILLKKLLNGSMDSYLLVIATWNDLGEGTGINRCYDYYWDGEWRRPTHFMELTRQSQEGKILSLEDVPGSYLPCFLPTHQDGA